MNYRVALLLILFSGIVSCNRSLDSLEGPRQGRVSGLVCSKLPTLTAALEMPISQPALISEGHCTILTYSQEVDVIRTIMMPGDGKYSQFTVSSPGTNNPMWIKTSAINPI